MWYVPLTRFNGVGWDKIYRDRYWKKEHFDAIGGHPKNFHIRNVFFFGAPYLFVFFWDTSGFDTRKVLWQRSASNFATFCTILNNKKKVRIISAPKQFWIWFFSVIAENLKALLAAQYPEGEVSVPEAAYRWLYHHSRLSGEHGDCVVVGASRPEQLMTNLGYTLRPPLDKPVVQFFNEWWKSTKHLCPKYFR
jgi:hypothetical protein